MKKKINKVSNKTFGYFFTTIFFCIFVFSYLKDNQILSISFLLISGIIFLITKLKPHWLFYFNVGWINLGLLLSKIITPIILSIIFYFIVFPIGFIKKIFTWSDFKNRTKIDNNRNTYWKKYLKINSNPNDPF
tara:strand:+ start:1533 stop:1931 length:399 start_codon:yes stop_codon:yes gene_type:complete